MFSLGVIISNIYNQFWAEINKTEAGYIGHVEVIYMSKNKIVKQDVIKDATHTRNGITSVSIAKVLQSIGFQCDVQEDFVIIAKKEDKNIKITSHKAYINGKEINISLSRITPPKDYFMSEFDFHDIMGEIDSNMQITHQFQNISILVIN